jgi:hypothetical protein
MPNLRENKSVRTTLCRACGICHDSVHRAAMVPGLENLRHPTNEEHWRKWTRSGRPGLNGCRLLRKRRVVPLTDEQVESLVKVPYRLHHGEGETCEGATPVATSRRFSPPRAGATVRRDALSEDKRAVGLAEPWQDASSPSRGPKAAANPHKSICWRRACVSAGLTVHTLREPGGTPIGEEIRHTLQHSAQNQAMTAEAELLLMNASRAQLVREVIRPALRAGEIVLCDRFYDSTTGVPGLRARP